MEILMKIKLVRQLKGKWMAYIYAKDAKAIEEGLL
jgi:hypothetical protein